MLAQPLTEIIIPQTRAEVIALGAIREASKRKLGFVAEVCDRAEGKPRVVADITTHDPLADLVLAMTKMSEQLGPPEAPAEFRADCEEPQT